MAESIEKIGNSEKVGAFFVSVERLARRYLSRWKEEKFSSRRIVKEIKKTMNGKEGSKKLFAFFLALERRIDERYATIWQTIFRYFSWKRETSLLSALKTQLKVPQNMRAEEAVKREEIRIKEEENGDLTGKQHRDGKKGKLKQRSENGSEQETIQGDEAAEIVEEKTSETKDELDDEKEEQAEERETKEAEKEVEPPDIDVKENSVDMPTTAEETESTVGGKSEENEQPKTESKDPLKTEHTASATQKTTTAQPFSDNATIVGNVFPFETLQNYDTPPERKGEERRDIYTYERPNIRQDTNDAPVSKENSRAEQAKSADKSIPLVKPTETPVQKDGTLPIRSFDADRVQPLQSEGTTLLTNGKEGLSDENRARIERREAFEKAGEQESKDVYESMSKQLNQQMEEAEAQGDIERMPIFVREVLDRKATVAARVPSARDNAPVAPKK